MTSSLVGSEMCIRDSTACPDRSPLHAESCKSVFSQQQSRRREATPNTDSVSYTHLTLPTICSV
eukprot:10119319-Prorocentrum_lima.AAC.1